MTRPMSEKLEPCPFCGSPFAELTLFDTPHNERWWRVECQSCCAKSQGAKYPAVAATSWNRRSTSAAVRGMREALEEAEEALKSWRTFGCPQCGGDCAAANPNPMWCIVKIGESALAKIAALSGIEPGEDEQATRASGPTAPTDRL